MKKTHQSKRAWIAAGMLIIATIAADAAVVKTLGGGVTPFSRARKGYKDGSTLMQAKFNQPSGIAILPDGNLIIADRKNKRLREVTFPGVDDLSLTLTFAERLMFPVGVAADEEGNVYAVNERDGTVVIFDAVGISNHVYTGFSSPTAIAVDEATNLYVAQLDGSIVKVDPDGNRVELVTGFTEPRGIAVIDANTIAVTDAGAHAVYKVDSTTGVPTLVAGGNGPGFHNGAAASAQFNTPWGIGSAPNGTLVVADRYNHRVRVIGTNGLVSTLYGASESSWFRPFVGWRDGSGNAAQGREPVAIAVATNGTVYVAEAYWHTIRQVTQTGLVTTNTGTNTIVVTNETTFTIPGMNPMGVPNTVTPAVPVFSIWDGSEPATTSRIVKLLNNGGIIDRSETAADVMPRPLRAWQRTARVSETGIPLDMRG